MVKHSTIPATSTYTYLRQTLSDLDTTKTYELSVDYRLINHMGTQFQCYIGFAQNAWSSWLTRSMIQPSVNPQWTKYSQIWQPTASSQDIYLTFACAAAVNWATFEFDNFQMPIGTTSVCSTSTPSPILSTSSPAVASSTVSSSEAFESIHATSSQASVGLAHSSSLPEISRLPSITISPQRSSIVSPTPASSLSRDPPASLGQSSLPATIHSSPSAQLPSLISSKPAQSPPAVSPSTIPNKSVFVSSPSVSATPISSNVRTSSVRMSSKPGVVLSPSSVPILLPSGSIDGNGLLGSSGIANKPTPLSPFGPSRSNGGSPLVPGTLQETTNRPGIPKDTEPPVSLTTSTVLATRTSTVTACPSTVVHCPVASRTTFVTTETVVAYTTVCPVTEIAKPIQATQTTSSIFSTRTSFVTSCPDRQQFCALPHRKTETIRETILVSTTAYLAAIPTSNRRPVFIDKLAMSGLSPQPTQAGQFASGLSEGGSGSIEGIGNSLVYPPEITKTQFVFSTIYVTQTALATVCQASQPAQSQAPTSSLRPVYF